MTQVTEKLVWDRFCRGVDFKRRIGLYDTVRTNENYFIGNQWPKACPPRYSTF